MSTDIGGDIRLAIWASTPEWSPFTEPAPKARLQPGHHTVRATGGSLNYVVPQHSDEPFTGLERRPATTFAKDLSQKSGLAGLEARTQRDRDQRHREKVDT